MAEFTMDLDLSGEGGGISEEDIGPVYEYLNGKYMGQQGVGRGVPDFGLDFGGKGYGGGGIRSMNFGTDWQRNMIGLGNSPANFGWEIQSIHYKYFYSWWV